MNSPTSIVRNSITLVSIAGAFYVAWQIKEVFMVVFGGIVVAGILMAFSDGIRRIASLPHNVAVGIAVFLFVLALGGFSWWGGDQFIKQLDQIWNRLPQAFDALVEWLRQSELGDRLLARYKDANPTDWVPWGKMAGYTTAFLSGLTTMVLIIVLGVYLAAAPDVYTRGIIRLIPPLYRQRTDRALQAAGQGLRQWLLGQLVAMLLVGALTGIGLMLLGVPMALTLGVLAGLTEFVPLIGPIGFGLLATVMAFSEGPDKALQVALLVLIIQQLESNVIAPLIQKRAVSLPPALALVAFIIFGILFGVLGILFAIPLMVTTRVLIDQLYVKGALEQEVENEG